MTTVIMSTNLPNGQNTNTTTNMSTSSDSFTATQVASKTTTKEFTEQTESTIAPITESSSEQEDPIINTDSTVSSAGPSPPSSSVTLPVSPEITTEVPGLSSPDLSSTDPAPISAGLSLTTTEPDSTAG